MKQKMEVKGVLHEEQQKYERLEKKLNIVEKIGMVVSTFSLGLLCFATFIYAILKIILLWPR